ncbi:MAG: tetratricopeptide repeat protein [Vicinamibacterales bacterium]
MSGDTTAPADKLSPSAFMRQLRPELYSDTIDRTTYQLDAPTLGYHLETITARNQTHDFEIFCRKLSERTICPNLKPATGPEGGGDSKADTETIPIADEISGLTYVGDANAGRERWAFAFSAKKKWAEKVRSDVAAIVGTGRGYQKIYCITAQFARAKDRARIEDALTRQHGVTVTILDRTWIVEQVIDGDRKDIAFNYLGVGQQVQDAGRLGPSDYSRARQLEDIEKSLDDPQSFAGMEMQRVTEALVAAKLSRNLERPRTETDGRFARAVRLAETRGTYRQRLETNYEWIWTGFWWFDDIALLNQSYDAFETLALNTDHVKNLEFLCNLAQNLYNAVLHGHISADEARLADRVKRLSDRLEAMAADTHRPNNALEARTSLLVLQASQAMLDGAAQALGALWPRFSEVLKQAEGLGEFPAERLIKMIEVFGNVAGNDSGYASLVDEMAAFVSKRTGEGQGALVLLKRAEQLGFDNHFEMIRLLGKAARQLTKKEYEDSLVDAMRLLSLAYRSAGLPWAARASCIFAIASMFIEAEEDNDLPASTVPTLMLLGWIALELRHVPDFLEAMRLIRGCAAGLPLDAPSKARVAQRLQEFDLLFASHVLNFGPSELEEAAGLAEVLERLGFLQSRTALLYALGHEATLREEGWIPSEETAEKVADLFTQLASQPASDNPSGPVIFNEQKPQRYGTKVLGIRIDVSHQGSEASILAAEAVIGSIEALFATTLDSHALPHTESFAIEIQEGADTTEPDFTIDEAHMTATVRWPANRLPATYAHQGEVQKMLVSLAASVFATTCFVQDMKATLDRFFADESVLDRIAMIAVVGTSRQRALNASVSRLKEWTHLVQTKFTIQSVRPTIVRRKLEVADKRQRSDHAPAVSEVPGLSRDHRDLSVSSVIDLHLWNRAGWRGTGFTRSGRGHTPALALLFTQREAARRIFERWRDRFGAIDEHDDIYIAVVRGLSPSEPAHYRVLITSRLPPALEASNREQLLIASRIQTMQPSSDANLTTFLDLYRRAGAYLLAPAIVRKDGEPEFLFDVAILKRQLVVKMASEIGEHDLEAIALGPALD